MSTVSDVILETLADAGATDVFGIPGDAINHLIDAMRGEDRLRFVHVRHEETGAFAASMQAKLGAPFGVCLGTAGPGAVHLLNGLYDAAKDGAPVVAITGQVARDEQGFDQHQGLDLHAALADVAISTRTLTTAAQAPAAIRRAIQEAVQGRGVVHLAVPADLAGAKVPSDSHVPALVLDRPQLAPDAARLDQAAALLRDADDVTILVGRGAAGARREVVELATRLRAPIVRALRAINHFDDETPNVVGGLGLLGDRGGVEAVRGADVLVLVGTDFPYRDFYPEGTRTIAIDIDAMRIGRRHDVEVPLIADAKAAVRGILDRLPAGMERSESHLLRATKAQAAWRKLIGLAEVDESTPIKPQRLAAVLGNHADDDAIWAVDTGAVTAWAARHLGVRNGQGFEISGGLASMGFGLPAAIGAQMAHPDRQVIALVGDGSMTMAPGDLATIAALGLPVTIVVFDNGELGLITLEQKAEGLPEHATSVPAVDWAMLARSMGVDGINVDDHADLDAAIATALASPRPTVVGVRIASGELIIPPKVHASQAIGFVRGLAKDLLGVGDADAGLSKQEVSR